VGWNSLDVRRPSALVEGIETGDQVYFTHSYAAPVIADTVASTTYGWPFSAVVARDRVAAMQFHPEKSGDVGLRLLRNWYRAV
jgi:glutamine amidotransferase